MPTPAQTRAARPLAHLGKADLVAADGLSTPKVKRVESDLDFSTSDDAVAAISNTIQRRGFEFTSGKPDGAGVRQCKSKS